MRWSAARCAPSRSARRTPGRWKSKTFPKGPDIRLLPDGRRLHLQHGPIDLVVGASGAQTEIEAAYRQIGAAFQDVLRRLADELALLRTPLGARRPEPAGPVARRMVAACWPHRAVFVTPMAAVAGAVADEMLAALVAGRALETAYVNNGGDIAIHLAPGSVLELGVVARLDAPSIDATARLAHAMPVRGIATSGWRGRSRSFGIADSATVLAADAAAADVAATLIANEVTLDDPAIARRPASDLDDDSDLGDRPVTVAVGRLSKPAVDQALDRGARCARAMRRAGQIAAAMLVLRDRRRTIGDAGALAPG
ncbi:MAG: UPF0280 family protein [Defluviicoccus sp.]|nr:UPF0280 family protein [Defluviicoccus sp.]